MPFATEVQVAPLCSPLYHHGAWLRLSTESVAPFCPMFVKLTFVRTGCIPTSFDHGPLPFAFFACTCMPKVRRVTRLQGCVGQIPSRALAPNSVAAMPAPGSLIMYPVMAEPPLSAGAVQRTRIQLPDFAMTAVIVGAPGGEFASDGEGNRASAPSAARVANANRRIGRARECRRRDRFIQPAACRQRRIRTSVRGGGYLSYQSRQAGPAL